MILVVLLGGCIESKDSGEPVEPMSFSEIETEVLGLSCAFSSCHGAGAGGLTLMVSMITTDLLVLLLHRLTELFWLLRVI